MTVLLLMAITTYGNLVLTGVVEEKSSRVVEVLLARMPARNLLAGKVAGIGLLGLAQFARDRAGRARRHQGRRLRSTSRPSAAACSPGSSCGSCSATPSTPWSYGALGSLASRTEDAQSVAGPGRRSC